MSRRSSTCRRQTKRTSRQPRCVRNSKGHPSGSVQLEEQLASKSSESPLPAATTDQVLDLDSLSARKQQADETAATLTNQLQQIATEIERRAARRPQLAELQTQLEKQLEDLPSQLVAPAPEGEHPEVTAVRLLRLRCRQHRLSSELALAGAGEPNLRGDSASLDAATGPRCTRGA